MGLQDDRGTRSPLPARTLREEVLVVLSLSLLASAVDAVISFTAGPARRDTRSSPVSQTTLFPQQLADVVFLRTCSRSGSSCILVRRNGEGSRSIGLAWDRPRRDLGVGARAVRRRSGSRGIGVYLGAVALGVNRFVVPVPPLGHWWTVPVPAARRGSRPPSSRRSSSSGSSSRACSSCAYTRGPRSRPSAERAPARHVPPLPGLRRASRATSRSGALLRPRVHANPTDVAARRSPTSCSTSARAWATCSSESTSPASRRHGTAWLGLRLAPARPPKGYTRRGEALPREVSRCRTCWSTCRGRGVPVHR